MHKLKFIIQDEEYKNPYHHLIEIDDDSFKLHQSLPWGLEYFSYINYILGIVKKQEFNFAAEIGCGDGKVLLELAKIFPNKKFEGYDLSSRAIAFAKAFSNNVQNINFYNLDFKKSFKKYDLLLCIEVLEHIPPSKVRGFVEQLDAHINVGGRIIFSVPTLIKPMQKKHYRHYALDTLTNIFRRNYRLLNYSYLHKQNIAYCLIRSMLENPIFVLNFKPAIQLLKKLYLRLCCKANKQDGYHLVAILEKISE